MQVWFVVAFCGNIGGTPRDRKGAGIMPGIITAAAIAGIIIAVAVSLRIAFATRSDSGSKAGTVSHYQPRHTVQIPVVVPADDTEELSSFDRRQYIDSQERLAESHEHQMFLASDEIWAIEIREIFADSARIDQFLQQGSLAVADWLPGKQVI